jgi:hypothetical protein
VARPEKGIGSTPRRLTLSGGWIALMAEVGAPMELEERLAELERLRSEGSLTEIGYNLQRNLLITRSEELARRRSAAPVVPLRHAPPSRRVTPRSRRATPSSRGVAPAPTRLAPLSRLAGEPARAQALRVSRRWARLVSRPALLAAAVIVVAAGAFAVYHATRGAAVTASTTADTPQGGGGAAAPTTELIPSAPPTTTPAPPPTVIDVTKATLSGGSVTLLGYADHFASGSSINNPLPPGGFYAAVQLKICAGPVESIASPLQFVLTEPDKTQVGVATGPTVGRQPELSLQQLSPGSCTTGWLSYGVTSRPTALDDTGDSLTWTVPS